MTRTTALGVVLLAATTLFAQSTDTPPPNPNPPQAQTQPSAGVQALPDSARAVVKKRYPVIYSEKARQKKLQGAVVLSVLFNEAGSVEKAEIAEGDPILAQCAMDSIKRWKIEPFIRNGAPAKVTAPVPFVFVFDGALTAQAAGPSVDRITISTLGLSQMDKMVPPVYPRRDGIHPQGSVIFAAVIGNDGAVQEIYTLASPHPQLQRAAEDAVRQWHYKPHIYQGRSVACDVRIQVNFTIGM